MFIHRDAAGDGVGVQDVTMANGEIGKKTDDAGNGGPVVFYENGKPKDDLIFLYKNEESEERAAPIEMRRSNQHIEAIVHLDSDSDEDSITDDCPLSIFEDNNDIFHMIKRTLTSPLNFSMANEAYRSTMHLNGSYSDTLGTRNFADIFQMLKQNKPSLLDLIQKKHMSRNYYDNMDEIITHVQNTLQQLEKISNGYYLTSRAKELWVGRKQEENSPKSLAILSNLTYYTPTPKNIHVDDIQRDTKLKLTNNIDEFYNKKIFGLPTIHFNISQKDTDKIKIKCEINDNIFAFPRKSNSALATLNNNEQINNSTLVVKQSCLILEANRNLQEMAHNCIADKNNKIEESDNHIEETENNMEETDNHIELIGNQNEEMNTHTIIETVKSEESVEILDLSPSATVVNVDTSPTNTENSSSILSVTDDIECLTYVEQDEEDDDSIQFEDYSQIRDEKISVRSPLELNVSIPRLGVCSPLIEDSTEEYSNSSKTRSPSRKREKSPYENKSYQIEEKKRKKLLELREKRTLKTKPMTVNTVKTKNNATKISSVPHVSNSVTKLSITNKSFYNSIFGKGESKRQATPKKRQLSLDLALSSESEDGIQELNSLTTISGNDSERFVQKNFYLDNTETEIGSMLDNHVEIEAEPTESIISSAFADDFSYPCDNDFCEDTIAETVFSEDKKDERSNVKETPPKDSFEIQNKEVTPIINVKNTNSNHVQKETMKQVTPVKNVSPITKNNIEKIYFLLNKLKALDGPSIEKITEEPSLESNHSESSSSVINNMNIYKTMLEKKSNFRQVKKPQPEPGPLRAISQLLQNFENVQKRNSENNDNNTIESKINARRTHIRNHLAKYREERNKNDPNKTVLNNTPRKTMTNAQTDMNFDNFIEDAKKEARGEAVKGPASPRPFSRIDALAQPKNRVVPRREVQTQPTRPARVKLTSTTSWEKTQSNYNPNKVLPRKSESPTKPVQLNPEKPRVEARKTVPTGVKPNKTPMTRVLSPDAVKRQSVPGRSAVTRKPSLISTEKRMPLPTKQLPGTKTSQVKDDLMEIIEKSLNRSSNSSKGDFDTNKSNSSVICPQTCEVNISSESFKSSVMKSPSIFRQMSPFEKISETSIRFAASIETVKLVHTISLNYIPNRNLPHYYNQNYSKQTALGKCSSDGSIFIKNTSISQSMKKFNGVNFNFKEFSNLNFIKMLSSPYIRTDVSVEHPLTLGFVFPEYMNPGNSSKHDGAKSVSMKLSKQLKIHVAQDKRSDFVVSEIKPVPFSIKSHRKEIKSKREISFPIPSPKKEAKKKTQQTELCANNTDISESNTSLNMLVDLLNEIKHITSNQVSIPVKPPSNIKDDHNQVSIKSETSTCDVDVFNNASHSITTLKRMRQLNSSPSLLSIYLSSEVGLRDRNTFSRIQIDEAVGDDLWKENKVCTFTDVPSFMAMNVCQSTNVSGENESLSNLAPYDIQSYNVANEIEEDKIIEDKCYIQGTEDTNQYHIQNYDEINGTLGDKCNEQRIEINKCLKEIDVITLTNTIVKNKVSEEESNDEFSNCLDNDAPKVHISKHKHIKKLKKTKTKATAKLAHNINIKEAITASVTDRPNNLAVITEIQPDIKVKRQILVTVYSILVFTVFAALSLPNVGNVI